MALAIASISTAALPRTPCSIAAPRRLRQHRARFLRIDRGEAQRGILQQLDENSAEADHDQRTEALIAHDAGDQLEARLRHRLNRDALEPRAGLLLPQRLADAREPRAHLLDGVQVELDAADVALVSDIGRQYFQHDRKAHFDACSAARRRRCRRARQSRTGCRSRRGFFSIRFRTARVRPAAAASAMI